VAIVPSYFLKCNSNQALAKLRFKKNGLDPYYALSFLMSRFGQLQCTREAAGAVQKNLYLYNINKIEILTPSKVIQRAIGNFLRKAERLRELAEVACDELDILINCCLNWHVTEKDISKLGLWITPQEFGHRLDGQYNNPRRLSLIRHLRKQGCSFKLLGDLANISAMIGWKGLTTEHYSQSGPYLVRGVDFDNGILSFDNMVHVDRTKYLEQPQIHLIPGDCIMTKDGTIGKALTIPEIKDEMCAGSTVARIRTHNKDQDHSS